MKTGSLEGGVTRGAAVLLKDRVYGCFFYLKKSNRGMVRFHFFIFIFLSKSLMRCSFSAATAPCFHELQTDGDCVPFCRAALGGAGPGRTKGELSGTQEDQGCNGRCPRGPRFHKMASRRTKRAFVAPGKMITGVVVTIVIVVVID